MHADTEHQHISAYCASLGRDPLLVQGAGGNLSWKDQDTLWIKASGTWLAQAQEKDIFVPVALTELKQAAQLRAYNTVPRVQFDYTLRPSIETMLHVLMPHRIVLHLHPVDVLTYLVRERFETDFERLFSSHVRWAAVDYHKPGASLAEAVHDAIIKQPDLNVIYLKNHGVVIGGRDIEELNMSLQAILAALNPPKRPLTDTSFPKNTICIGQDLIYDPISDVDLHRLAQDEHLFHRVAHAWALYPDHVVFLGERAHCFQTQAQFKQVLAINTQGKDSHAYPLLVFIQGDGVWVRRGFSNAQLVQLRCYYEVLLRQPIDATLKPLAAVEIAALLNWEAEHYRQQMKV